MKKFFISINGRQIHFRTLGKGSPIILLHASPASSKMMIPLMEQLSEDYLVIAPDTPGYGLSDPLEGRPDNLLPYITHFHDFFDALQIKKIAIYGSATGAQLAIRYALTYPDRVDHVYLDNSAHFTESQRIKILETYFPSLEPQYSGEHLMRMWTLIRDLFVFFPWSFSEEEYRLKQNFPPAQVLHYVAMDFLQTGIGYDMAYKAAFNHEQASFVQQLKVPTTLFDWEGSIVRPYIKQLLDFDLPKNIEVVSIPVSAPRYNLIQRKIRATYLKQNLLSLPALLKQNDQGQFYIHLENGDLHGLKIQQGSKQPMLWLHDWRGSASLVRLKKDIFDLESPVFAISLPGHGDSDQFFQEYEIDDFVKVLHDGIHQLGLTDFRIAADGWGLEVAKRLKIIDPKIQILKENKAKMTPLPRVFEVEEYGSHLVKAWFYLRDQALFVNPEDKTVKGIRPGTPDLDPNHLQLKLREWFKCQF